MRCRSLSWSRADRRPSRRAAPGSSDRPRPIAFARHEPTRFLLRCAAESERRTAFARCGAHLVMRAHVHSARSLLPAGCADAERSPRLPRGNRAFCSGAGGAATAVFLSLLVVLGGAGVVYGVHYMRKRRLNLIHLGLGNQTGSFAELDARENVPPGCLCPVLFVGVRAKRASVCARACVRAPCCVQGSSRPMAPPRALSAASAEGCRLAPVPSPSHGRLPVHVVQCGYMFGSCHGVSLQELQEQNRATGAAAPPPPATSVP
jgi:hypothetical protein